jgi:hypothetical protein
MDSLPSYQEAIAKSDWLNLVAPYCNFDDYRALCLVNRRFQQIFAPRLWKDLFISARLAGVDPGDGKCEQRLELKLSFLIESFSRPLP